MRSSQQFVHAALGATLFVTGLAALAPAPASANVAGTGLVISEVYGGGGNTGAPYTNDFIELYNPTDDPISVDGWSVQGRSATNTGSANANVTPLTGSVPANGYYLIQQGAGTTVLDKPLPTPDATGTIAMGAAGWQVWLADTTTALTPPTGNVPAGTPNIIDFVGGATNAASFETARVGSAPSNTLSIARNASNADSDSNLADFTAGAPTPTNSDTGEPTPLAATDPGDRTYTQAQAITPLQLAATGGTPPYEWAVTAGTLPTGLELSASGQLTGTPSMVTESPVEITVTVTDDVDATAATTFTITVAEPLAITPIAELQGTGARSPFAPESGNGTGSEVKSTEGVVTAAYYTGGFNGLYIQTPGADTADASDGIFVYGGSSNANIPAGLQVGDSVRVTGRLAEFFDLTQIVPASASAVTELESSLGTVTPRSIAYPTSAEERERREGELIAPTDDFTVSNNYSTNQYGEIGLATGDLPLRQPTEHADDDDPAALALIDADNLARGVRLDDGATTDFLQNQANKALPVPWLTVAGGGANPNPPRVGGPADLHAPVILDWRNNAWKFQPQSQVVLNGADVATFGTDRADNLVPADVLGADGDVKIATFNVLNYFNTTGEAYAAAGPLQNPPLDTFCSYYTDRGPGGDNGTDASDRIGNNSCGVRLLDDPDTPANEANTNDGRGPRGAATAASLARQEAKLANTIVAMDADVIGLEEVENSIKLPGETNRDDAVARIVALLNAIEGAGTWKYVRSPGESTTAAAVAEQDVIRSAFIYKPAAVSPVGQSDILFGTDEFANAREPLAQAFKKTGGLDADAFAVIVNHFKSKGDNQNPAPPAGGDNTNSPYFGAFNGDRTRQATRLLQFADDFAADRGIEAVFLAGDFNSYTKEDPITVLEQGGFELVESTDDPAEESYSFSGYSGSLDHVLANAAAVDLVTGADIWEINANEAISFQYSRYNYNVTNFWQPDLPFATSDHNPEIVGLDLPDETEPSYKEIQVVGTNDFHGRLLPDGGNAAGAAPFATAIDELRAENPNTVFVAAGDLVGASTFESFVQDDEPTIEALNAMGLEVSAAGNHEFDKGYADFEGRIRDLADWQYIAANLDYEGIPTEDQLAETWVKEVDGERIGFVGAVTEDLPALVNPTGIEGITVTDIVDATNAAAASLRSADNPGGPVDLVILLVHEGSPTTDCASASFTDPATVWGNVVQNTSADVDAIISGHTHLAYNCKYTVGDWVTDGRPVTKRPVVSAGQYGSNLNQLVFKFDEETGELAGIDQEIVATAGVGYEADPTVQGIVDAAVEFADEKGDDVLGQMEGSFKRASYTSSAGATENRGGESTLSNQVAEVQRWATEEAGVPTDIAFMNPGGLRADMLGSANSGDPTLQDLTYRQAADVQPFANTLVNLKLTGAQLETVLEQQWQRTATGGVPSRPFLRLGVSEGFTYTYVETPAKVEAPNSAPVNTFAGEVTGMWLDGEPVDAAATYSVTVNSFLGGGGDNFWEFANGTGKVDTGQVDLQAMVDYMSQYDEANPLPVDHSQRAVELTFPEDAPATYGEGDTLAFDIASWSMSASGDVQDTQLEVRSGDTVLGTFPVTNTAGTTPYDNTGTASVSVTVPDLPDGVQELTLHGPATGTSIPVLIEVDDVMDVQIVGTNDFHGRLLVDESPATATCDTVLCPAAVLSGTVKQMRSENPNTVFVAAGDLIGASTFESFIQDDEPTIDVLNEAGLEVSAAGNHEFDQGYEDLVGRVQDHADWEYLAANVEEPEGRDDLAETWTKEFGDITVGFVGAVTEELPSLVSPDGIEGLTVTDIVDATNAAAADLRAGGADVVVLLVHEGSPSVDCASPNFTSEGTVWGNISQNVSSDVDAIVSGHTHLAYDCSLPVQDWIDEGRAVTERPVVSAGQYGQNLNKLVFSVDTETGEVMAKTQSIVALNASSPSDPAVEAIVNDAKAVAEEQGAVKIGELAAPFNRARVSGSTDPNRGGESTLSNQVAEVQRWATEKPESGSAQIAFMNPGGLRSDMAGQVTGDTRELTYKGAAVVQPFANTLVNMDLTGAQIETVLEQQWQRQANGTVPTRPFLRLGVSQGFSYTYVETPVTVSGTATFQGEVTGMWLEGEPIDPAATYSVTVNSFLGSGGDNFREFANGAGKADTGKVDLAAMVDYMATFAATDPLPVDYSQRAVEVEFPADAPESYSPGEDVAFAVGSLAMTAPGDVTDDEIVVTLGDEELGTFAVDNTVGTERYDTYGTAGVDVTLPVDVAEGPAVLTLTGAETGTEVLVPIEVVEPLPVIANYVAPKVTGTPRLGKTVTASEGTWAPEPTGYAYRWFAGGVEIAGETGPTLKLRRAQLGQRITVEVTASADGYADTALTSAPSAPVAKGAVTVSARVAPSPVIVNRSSVAVGVRVANPDGLTVAGQVTVKVAGKTVTGRLVNGRVTIRIGRMPTTGLKRVYVTYLGNAVMASQRVITSFTVVRR